MEGTLRRDWDARVYDRVATRTIEAYGPEIIGVMAVQLRSIYDALEVSSMFLEDLWRGLPEFQWRCSFRAWAHKLARNAGTRWATAGARQPQSKHPAIGRERPRRRRRARTNQHRGPPAQRGEVGVARPP